MASGCHASNPYGNALAVCLLNHVHAAHAHAYAYAEQGLNKVCIHGWCLNHLVLKLAAYRLATHAGQGGV